MSSSAVLSACLLCASTCLKRSCSGCASAAAPTACGWLLLCALCSNVQERLCRALLQHQHPAAQLSAASLAALRSGEDSILAARVSAWREALRGAYSSLRHGHCPVLYVSGQVRSGLEGLHAPAWCAAAQQLHFTLSACSQPTIGGTLLQSELQEAVCINQSSLLI